MIGAMHSEMQISNLAIDAATMIQPQVSKIVFSHYVRAECESKYKGWLNQISQLAECFSGQKMMKVKRSPSIFCVKYTISLHFDTCSNLDLWIKSPMRKAWFSVAESLIAKEVSPKIYTPYKPAFYLKEAKKSSISSSTPQYKTSFVTWIGVYISASGLGVILAPFLAGLPYLVAQAIATGAVVIMVDYVFMPRLQTLFGGWLKQK